VSGRIRHEAGRYLLDASTAEIQHLVAQAEVYAAEAEQLLDAVGLAPGASAIDLGCGMMGILDLLVARVGEKGRVVGLDLEGRILTAAKSLAQERGLHVEFIEADATETGLPTASFDFVHARTLLLNVNKPSEIIREMVRLARAGGTVAVEEPDAASWVCDPPHPVWSLLRDAIRSAYRRTGKDFDIGRRTGRLLREAGLQDVAVRATARVTRLGDYYQTFLLTIAQLVRDVILETGELTEDELRSYTAILRAHLEAPDTLTCQPLMWQAWGRKAA
jgi:ubiquinone/menaquinone biosynthesis C-methylase UbiE